MARIIIDGYNFIRRSQRLSQIDAVNLEKGREAFVQELSAYKKIKNHQITVVFDASKREFSSVHEEKIKGIRVQFTASGQSADEVIIETARRLKAQCLVVSSDNEILRAARIAGCGLLTSEEFEQKMQKAYFETSVGSKEEAAPLPRTHKRWLTKKKGPSKRLPKAKRRAHSHLLGLLFLLMGHPVLASDAEGLITQLQNQYQKAQTWQADFLQDTDVAILKKNLEKQGKIFVKKPGKVRMEYPGKLYVSNGKKLWVYSPSDQQVVVFNNLSHQMSQKIFSILQGFGEIKKDFTAQNVTDVSTSMIQDRELNLVELTPKEESRFEKIILGIDEKSRVKELTIFNLSGNKTHYIFNHIKINSAILDATFEFHLPKGVSVLKG